jgi:transcriptional regulator with XRE-family HTH domain
MQRTMVEELTSTPEGMAAFQQERVILEVAILIRRLLKEQGLSKADLAARLGRSKAFVTQLLDGHANMTLRTISDVMCALGHSLRVSAGDLNIRSARAGIVFDSGRTPQVLSFPKTEHLSQYPGNRTGTGD